MFFIQLDVSPRNGSMKACSRCKEVKPLTEFHSRSEGSRLKSQCKDCIQSQRAQRLYNITRDDFERMLMKQEGRCAICKTIPKRKLDIDHCHQTGKVRGLLCNRCNIVLGQVEDNVELLKCAVEYLQHA